MSSAYAKPPTRSAGVVGVIGHLVHRAPGIGRPSLESGAEHRADQGSGVSATSVIRSTIG
ncbi:hypothetical protein [Streptomyces sp. NPDC093149]|uniref:hypothetical protein n=1 Tax=Streptomyces sp. NPDC093149 TaxID=3366031 RepID=UPI003823FE0F